MPESRDRLVRGDAAREIAGAFEIRRGVGPVVRSRPMPPPENKENAPVRGSSSMLRRGHRRSPLPEWYPRTPLRDITVIVNAMERRRIRLRAAARRQRNVSIEASTPALPSNPPQEVIISEQTPASQVAPTEVSETSNLQTPTDCPQQTSSSPKKEVSEDSKFTEPDKKLWTSFEEIEKVVVEDLKSMEDLKRTTKEAVKKTSRRSTLMSLR